MEGIISQETIDNVSSQADIVSVVSDYVQLENRGNQWWGCCPFHHEKTPSFCVTPEKRMYYCFGCHAGGGAINFVMEMEKVRFPEAVKILAKKFNVEVKYSNNFVPKADKPDNSKELYIDLYNRVADMFHYGLSSSAIPRRTGAGLSVFLNLKISVMNSLRSQVCSAKNILT